MPRWSEVEKDPRYLTLTDEVERQKVRQKFYDKHVVPRFNSLNASEEEKKRVINKIFKGKFVQAPFEKAKTKVLNIAAQRAQPQEIQPGINALIPGTAMPQPSPMQNLEQSFAAVQEQLTDPLKPYGKIQKLLPHTDFQQKAFQHGLLPTQPKEQRLMLKMAKKDYPVSYYGGQLTGYALSYILTGGVSAAMKTSPRIWLAAQRFGPNINQTINIMANAARSVSAYGAKKLADNILDIAVGGEKPTVGKLVGEPLEMAGFGLVLGGAVGIESTAARLAVTGAASAGYDTIVKTGKRLWELYGGQEHTKEDVINDLRDITLMAGIRTAVRSIGSAKLTQQLKEARIVDFYQNKSLAGIMHGKAGTATEWASARKTLLEPKALSKAIGKQVFGMSEAEVSAKLVKPGPHHPTIKELHDMVFKTAGPIVYEQVIETKMPGFEGLPPDMKEKLVGGIIGSIKGGMPIAQAIDSAAEAVRPITEQGLMFLQSLAGQIPPGEQVISGEPAISSPQKISSQEKMQAFFTGGLPKQAPALPKIKVPVKPIIKNSAIQDAYNKAMELIPEDIRNDIDVKAIVEVKFSDLYEGEGGRLERGGKGEHFVLIEKGEKDIVETLTHELLHSYVLRHPELEEGGGYFWMEDAVNKLHDKIKGRPGAKARAQVIKTKYLTQKPVTEQQKATIKNLRPKIKELELKLQTGKSSINSLTSSEADQLIKKLQAEKQTETATKMEKFFGIKKAKPKVGLTLEEAIKKPVPGIPEKFPGKEETVGIKFKAEGQELYKPIIEGTSNKIQRKIVHTMAKDAGMNEVAYRDIIEKMAGVRSITQVSEEDAQKVIHAIDDKLRVQEDKTLKSILISPKRKAEILENRITRLERIGRTVAPADYENQAKAVERINQGKVSKKDLKDLGVYKAMTETKEKDFPGIEATYLSNLRPVRHVFKADPKAWRMYKPLEKASKAADKLRFSLEKEVNEVVKKLGMSDKDLIAVREFMERTKEAPTTLTEKQAKFRDWLHKKQGENPGEGLHGLFKVKGFVKEDYISRRLDREAFSMEEILRDRLTDFVDDKKVLPKIKNWFDLTRTGKLKGAKKNALDIYKDYIRAGTRKLYFDDLLKNMRKEDLTKLQPGMKEAMNDYIYRLLGYPTTQAYKFQELLNRSLSVLPGVKGELSLKGTMNLAQFLVDFAYVRHLGFRLKSPTKNLIQTINNTVPELGLYWTARGFGRLFQKGFKEASKAGILLEFAPVMFREFAKGDYGDWWKTTKDYSLGMFQFSDMVNRCIAYYGSIDKFDHFLKSYRKHKNIPKFLKWLEVNHMHPRYQEDITEALQTGNVNEARKIYAEKITGDTQYLYTKQDSPLITSHPGGRMLFQYASWPINYTELLVDDVKQKHWQAIARRLLLYVAIGGLIKTGVVDEKNLLRQATGLGPYKWKRQKDIVPASLAPIADTLDLILLQGARQALQKKLLTKKHFTRYGKKVLPLVGQDIQKAIEKKSVKELF